MTQRYRLHKVVSMGLMCLSLIACKSNPNKFRQRSQLDPSSSLDVGDRLCLPGADFTGAQSNLILAIEDTCPACMVSSKFFTELESRAHKGGVPVFVVRSSSHASDTGSDLALTGPVKMIAARGRVTGIKRVPTVLLVNNQGIVTNLWTGDVLPGRENASVAAFFEGKQGTSQSLQSLDIVGFNRLREDGARIQLVRVVNPAKSESIAPLPGEVFIPPQDLLVRAQYELNRKEPVVLDCRGVEGYNCQDSLILLRKHGFDRVEGLALRRLSQSPACTSD